MTQRDGKEGADQEAAAAGTAGAAQAVLVVEDNPANLKLMSSALGRLPGIELLTAQRPAHGLELAREHRPALVLMDINMPGMSGYELLERLREDEALKAIPVLAVTANAMPQDVERGRQAGFADYITKPINLAALLDSVSHWLGR
ncbi:MAG: response regulator [Pseudohaliea sp.]